MGRKPTLYIVGPITGYTNQNRHRFESAKRKLEAAGYKAIIPHDVVPSDAPWDKALRISIANMLIKADAVAFLDGNWSSKGASIEKVTAADCGMAVRSVSKWVEIAPVRPAYTAVD